MDNLDYALSGEASKRKNEGFVVEAKPRQEPTQDEAVAFSIEIIKALEEKVKAHNLEFPKKVTILQLKKVFCNAVSEYEKTEGISNTIWAFSRVNMYSRMVSGKVFKLKEVLEAEQNITYNRFTEITALWIPLEEDFVEAALLVESKNLHYSFKTLDELYLTFQPTQSFLY